MTQKDIHLTYSPYVFQKKAGCARKVDAGGRVRRKVRWKSYGPSCTARLSAVVFLVDRTGLPYARTYVLGFHVCT